MATLSDVATPVPDGTHFALDVPAGWKQGRGAFGGFVVAAAIRAIEARCADAARKVRSVTAELPSPLDVGAASIAVDVLRVGNAVTTARAAIEQAGELRAHAVAVLAATRPGAGPAGWSDLEPPQAPPWQKVDPVPAGGPFPEFAAHFEYRVVEGVPLSNGPARVVGWVRPRDRGASGAQSERGVVRDAGYVAAVIDAFWPAALVRYDSFRPMGTIAYTLDILNNLEGLDPETPLLYRSTAPYCADGYFVETRELWGEDGRLVALNHQTFVVIK